MKHHQLVPVLLLILLGTLWGTGYSIARFAMTHDVPPLGYSFWQSIGPAIIIGFISIVHFNKRFLSSTHLLYYFICGLTGIVIPNTTMYFAAAHLPANLLAMVVNIVPIVAYPMALIMKIELFNWQRFIGILFAFIGIMLIILPKTSLPHTNLTPWVLLTLITPLSFAFCTIFIAKFRPKPSDIIIETAGMLITSSLLLLPLVLITKSFYLFHLPLNLPDKIILLEIILSSIGYLLFFKLIRIAGPIFYSLVDTIVVMTGISWSYFIFHEKLNEWTSKALFFILLGIILVTQKQSSLKKESIDAID